MNTASMNTANGRRANRRHWLKKAFTAGVGSVALGGAAWLRGARASEPVPAKDATPSKETAGAAGKPTRFQIACMTLPYGQFPLERALKGIRGAGFDYVAWGTTHREGATGKKVPVMAPDAAPAKARELAQRCRDGGLEPVMMFSTVYPEHPNAIQKMTRRIDQAAAAGIGQLLTFGHTEGGNLQVWIERLKQLAPIARDHDVMIVVKQHGGATGTGEACAKIVREVNHPNIMVNYDAGNVMDYVNVDPIPDLRQCADWVRSFCIKDHREWPKDEDCGPGFGAVDHYQLLAQVAFTGREMPLCCENIFAPILERPDKAETVDALARRSRQYLQWVIAGLQRLPPKTETTEKD